MVFDRFALLDFLYDLDAFIEVYSSYLIYVLFIPFIYLFVSCYFCFCVLILLFYCLLLFLFLLLLVADDLNSFFCSLSGSSLYFILLSAISTLLFMLLVFINTLLFICFQYFIVISVLIRFID